MDHTEASDTSSTRHGRGIANVLNVGNTRISKLCYRSPFFMELQIKTSLTALLAAIKTADGQTVATEMAKLDGYLDAGRSSLHPQLVHFLENRSYAKAVMFLGGESDIPVGVCGGRAARKA